MGLKARIRHRQINEEKKDRQRARKEERERRVATEDAHAPSPQV